MKELKVKEKLYANQFVPLWEDVTIEEKCKREGVTSLLSGGGISHISCGEKILPKQARHLLDLMVDSGLEHCALNMVYSICEHDHYTYGKYETCPKCGGKVVDYYTRVVGFAVRTSNFNRIKKIHDFDKRNYKTHVGL